MPPWQHPAIARLGIEPEDKVAERWICCDDPVYPSLVRAADDHAIPFSTLVETYQEELLGREHADQFGPFLCAIMKLIDTNDRPTIGSLSIQVHPAYGFQRLPSKPEMWKGRGDIYLGWNRNVSEELIRQAVANGDLERYLNKIRLKPGLLVLVPGGTVHALRAGTFTAEWSKTPGGEFLVNGKGLSHATLALYDRTDGRDPRPGKENLDGALDVIRHAGGFDATTNFRSRPVDIFTDQDGNSRRCLFRTPDVFVEEWSVRTTLKFDHRRRGFPIFVESGKIIIHQAGRQHQLSTGDEAFLPACMGAFQIRSLGDRPALMQTWYRPFEDEESTWQEPSPSFVMQGEVILTDHDVQLLRVHGRSETAVLQQLELFRNGVRNTQLDRSCTIGDGIKRIGEDENEYLAKAYYQAVDAGRVSKFVPASGASTRLFHELLADKDTLKQKDSYQDLDEDDKSHLRDLTRFFDHLREFAFYDDFTAAVASRGFDINELVMQKAFQQLLSILFAPEGLGYSAVPKGLIPFHRYGTYSRTAFEEHLDEAATCIRDSNGIARVHFTLSAEFENRVRKFIEHIRSDYEQLNTRLDISYSIQSPDTDLIAVDSNNNPLRDQKGQLLFRPGGHGVLISNLNELNGDIVFIKNIDNVAPSHRRRNSDRYLTILGGYLIKLQEKIFSYLRYLIQQEKDPQVLEEIFCFTENELSISIDHAIKRSSTSRQAEYLTWLLDRPLRACAMVKNLGEPGGGPFWVQDSRFPLQIVDACQIDSSNQRQQEIWQSSTYFNPVNIVCGLRNYEGEPFDLGNFSEADNYTISEKFSLGRKLRALELPGLWNGGMSYWNTVFLEAPASIFSPVKSVFDLLRTEHR